MTADMGKLYIIYINRKILLIVAAMHFILITAVISFRIINLYEKNFIHSYTKIIVIDPGHGGIDGGATMGGILEKDVNLDIAKRVKDILERKGYMIVLTREMDHSLDNLVDSSASRHQRDLTARVNIINNSNAQLFLSIHANCHKSNLNADGSIILYNERFLQNKALAYCIQRALNNIVVEGKKRTIHDPQNHSAYFLLNNSKIPGVIVETAFISNQKEQQLLGEDSFKDEIAKAIAAGVENYFSEIKNVNREVN